MPGDDKRSPQAAAVRVASAKTDGGLNGLWDFRVDDSPKPIEKLRHLYELRKAVDGDI